MGKLTKYLNILVISIFYKIISQLFVENFAISLLVTLEFLKLVMFKFGLLHFQDLATLAHAIWTKEVSFFRTGNESRFVHPIFSVPTLFYNQPFSLSGPIKLFTQR
jgi:hypothetical protein